MTAKFSALVKFCIAMPSIVCLSLLAFPCQSETLECQVLNDKGVPTQTFIPGETLVLKLAFSLPGQVIPVQADFKVSGSIKKGGLTIPYEFRDFDLSVPIDKNGIVFKTEKHKKIDAIFSGSKASLQVKVKVKNVGKWKCSTKVIVN
ncbi:hypothetical protein [Methyloterricola oryzae]|uniref:hypothetical protein n=1 Tax=Methyloterricola oryzae TaxID=1495050 RepID=UPI0005EB0290|nr:hypothetical protein [Methyloterricola oryzae]